LATKRPERATEGVAALAAALNTHPVIAAVRSDDALAAVLASKVAVVFLMAAHIGSVGAVSAAVAREKKLLFIHLDFVEGLAKDEAGLGYLVKVARPTGLITTRTGLVQAARRAGVVPVQRLFLLDSQSVHTGVEAARSSKTEVVEVLPGIAPRAVAAVRSQLPHSLIITGGLVRTEKEIARALAAGASGVSTSNSALWAMDRSSFEGGAATP
jgi:glycerol uptake operon antiterminator